MSLRRPRTGLYTETTTVHRPTQGHGTGPAETLDDPHLPRLMSPVAPLSSTEGFRGPTPTRPKIPPYLLGTRFNRNEGLQTCVVLLVRNRRGFGPQVRLHVSCPPKVSKTCATPRDRWLRISRHRRPIILTSLGR